MKKLLIFLMLLFLVISCGKPASQKAFESRMTEIKTTNQANVKEFLEDGTDNLAVHKFADFYMNFFKKIEYKVLSVEEKGNESILQVEIKTPDILEPFIDIFTEVLSMAFSGATEEDINNFFSDNMDTILENKELNYMTGTIPVYMVKEDGSWDLDGKKNTELFIYLTGGLSTFAQD